MDKKILKDKLKKALFYKDVLEERVQLLGHNLIEIKMKENEGTKEDHAFDEWFLNWSIIELKSSAHFLEKIEVIVDDLQEELGSESSLNNKEKTLSKLDSLIEKAENEEKGKEV